MWNCSSRAHSIRVSITTVVYNRKFPSESWLLPTSYQTRIWRSTSRKQFISLLILTTIQYHLILLWNKVPILTIQSSTSATRLVPSKRENIITVSNQQFLESEGSTPRNRQKRYEIKYFWLTLSIITESEDKLPSILYQRIVKWPFTEKILFRTRKKRAKTIRLPPLPHDLYK